MSNLERRLAKSRYLWALVAVFCAMLWGSATPVIKFGYEAFGIAVGDTFSIILFAGLRFVGAGLFTLLLGFLLTKAFPKPYKALAGPVVVQASFQTIFQYGFLYLGLAQVTGTNGSIIGACASFFTVLISMFILRTESIKFRKILAIICGFLGILVLNLEDSMDFSFSFIGEGFVLLSALSLGISSIFTKRYTKDHDPLTLTAYQFIFGGLVMVVIGLLGGGKLSQINVPALLILAYLMIVSSLAYTLWAILIKVKPISQVVVFHTLTPVFGAIFSWLILGEDIFRLQTLLALILIITGILLINYEPQNKSSSS